VTVTQPRTTRKTYTLPPAMENKSPRVAVGEKKEPKAHLSTGTGKLKLEIVTADKIIHLSSDYNDSTKNNQYLTDNIRVSNTAGKCAVTKVTTQYWTTAGKWEDCTTKCGHLTDGWRGKELQLNAGVIPVNIDEKTSLDVAFQTHIPFTGSKISFQDHIHPVLGDPLRIKYLFTLSDGSSNEVVSEFVSPPIVFYDQNGFMKDNSVKDKNDLIYFQELDDVPFQRRYRMTCFLNDSKELVAKIAPSSTYHHWTKKDLTNIAGQAAAAGRSEWAVDAIVDKESGSATQTVFRQWLLVDTEALTVYGVKVTGRTSSGFAQTSGLIPWDRVKDD